MGTIVGSSDHRDADRPQAAMTRAPRGQRHIVIVGGGIMGSALAFALSAPANRPRPDTSRDDPWSDRGATTPDTEAPRVTVLERDPQYTIASSSLSASSIRQQFSQPVNIRLSQWSFRFYAAAVQQLSVPGQAPPALALHESGYCYLATAAGESRLRELHALQRAESVDVALLGPAQLRERLPQLEVADLACASVGLSGEGWFDGPAALQALRRKARSQGVVYQQGEVVDFMRAGTRVSAVKLVDGTHLSCDDVVLCTGAWTAVLAARLEVALPVAARKRDVFFFTSPAVIPHDLGFPLVVDPSGLWFRPEGRGWLCGGPPRGEDPDDVPLHVDHRLFDEVLWPALAHRVPAFEAARVVSSWAGYYEMNSFDANGLVGALPGTDNVWTACGFSGHRLQQAPAVGQALAELLLTGRFVSVDAAALSPARISAEQPLCEYNVI